MQSKNKSEVWILHPLWQTAGIFFTAAILSFILFVFQQRNHTAPENEYLYPVLLFCAVSVFYSFDHIYDEFQMRRDYSEKRLSLRMNSFILVVFSIAAGLFAWWNKNELNTRILWLPLLITALYFLVVLVLKFRLSGFKEVFISTAVALAVYYPSAARFGWAHENISMIHFALICLLNLVLFAFFEKDKDEVFGFKTLFSSMDPPRITFIISLIYGIVFFYLFDYFFRTNSNIKGYLFCEIIYTLMMVFHKIFRYKRIYRFIADAALLLVLI